MNLAELQSTAEAVEALLKSVGNRKRLIVLCELRKGERSVGALQQAIGLRQSALSQQLARLRLEGVVTTRRESQTIYYALASEKVSRLIGLLDELYCSSACNTSKSERKKKEDPMTLDQSVMRFAGFVVLISLALAYLLSPYWLWLAAFTGANMIQASFTGFCPAAIIFKRLGVKSGCAFS
jgi:DNA-binding transcriptional ArsR family regulator